MRLRNTATRRVEPFQPADGRAVRMYVCGPTASGPPHLGHARSLVLYDTLRRRLLAKGWRVRHVMNVTDIAEEIAHRAALEGRTIEATARRYAALHLRTARRLGVLRPTRVTWASDFVPRIVRDTQALLERGLAYERAGTVYLDAQGGKLLGLVSGYGFEDVTVGSPPATARRHEADFVLWRSSHDWGLCWRSPWGLGRPGWHNQCTAMALATLGPTLDLHGGGVDLAFPHHDSEAAVAQALTAKPLSRAWLHHGHVTVWREKMSKSRGNVVLAGEAVARHGGRAVRLFLLAAPYHEALDYRARALREAAELAAAHHRALAAARRAARGARASDAWEPWLRELGEALDDDLDTPRALGLLREASASVRRGAGAPRDAAAAARALGDAGGVLGLLDAAA